MTDTIAANGQTLCHKKSLGMVRSTVPDVCKAPKYPAPFTNVAFAKQLAKGTKTVLSHKGAMIGLKGSEFSTSIGNEPGVGGGVVSGVNKHKATWLSWSPNVFAEGKPVTRLSDKMLMNKGNTVSAGGYFTGTVTGANKATLDLLCEIACACLASGGNQNCVDLAVQAIPKPNNNGLFSEISFTPQGIMLTTADGTPSRQRGVSGSRMDVITVAGGRPVEFIEMKFPGDRFRGDQLQRYQNLARRNGRALQIITIPEDCNFCEMTDRETQSNWGWYALGGLAILGIGACIIASGGTCIAIVGAGTRALGPAAIRALTPAAAATAAGS